MAQQPKQVETLTHEKARRKNIPTAEHQPLLDEATEAPVRVAFERRNRDLDPQLVWRGKDAQDEADLTVNAPPLYIQEKVHPKALIDDLRRQSVISEQWLVNSEKDSERSEHKALSTSHSSQSTNQTQFDLFGDFNGLPKGADRTEFYQFDANWQNRMILGDSLQVMASLAEREGLRGQVQCIYLDPPYGIKFNSNFQWSTTSRDVKDGKAEHITREPEQVKAFRDTWKDGIHSYLTYLRDRLIVARDLLHESGSIFVQIGDENVHRVRALIDEVFGDQNYVSQIAYSTTTGRADQRVSVENDFILFYAKNRDLLKFRPVLVEKDPNEVKSYKYAVNSTRSYARTLGNDSKSEILESTSEQLAQLSFAVSQDPGKPEERFFKFRGRNFDCGKSRHWKTRNPEGLNRLGFASRLFPLATQLNYVRLFADNQFKPINNTWLDTGSAGYSGADPKRYVVQTDNLVIRRCLLMATDPGDLVVDPTCGSGTTATVAEQWGRRWITIDTSRVALALARARIMGARYPYYLLADSPEGRKKEAALRGLPVDSGQWLVDSKRQPATNHSPLTTAAPKVRLGFVYERVPHITLKSIANNAEIDVIWDKFEQQLAPLREQLSEVVGDEWLVDSRKGKHYDVELPDVIQEWEVPRERPENWPLSTNHLLEKFWEIRIQRQREIDASIAAKAEAEYLYDKPYQDKSKVRVAGPFTVESISPHRTLGVDENGEPIDPAQQNNQRKDIRDGDAASEPQDFVAMILDNLRTAGVQQAHKDGALEFTSLTPWPGDLICAVGTYQASDEWRVDSGEQEDALSTNHSSLSTQEYRAAIFIGPEFGTVSRADLVDAAREAAEADFDVLICCAFNYEAHTTELEKLGRLPVLKARMNADLHMAADLKNTGGGNLFVIFGEPDITVASEQWLVDSVGQRIAPYEIYKLISGLGGLAEINALDAADLRAYAQLSNRREVWDYIADAAGGDLDSGEYRGRSSQENHGGISSIAWHCARLAGGAGDISDVVRAAGLSADSGFNTLIERLHRDQQNAAGTDAITIHSPLTTIHYAQVRIHGVDVFHPNTGEVRADGPEGIACWFIDTDYDSESFFVRHAYFLGAADPYKSLKTTLRAEINQDAWDTLYSDTSRAFDKPSSGRIAVKVINHLGDEVMKVFRT